MKTIERAAGARAQIDRRFAAAGPLRTNLAQPAKGWIRAIREALGMTTQQLARRLGITQPSAIRLEASEIKGAIQLSTLRRAAEAMNCTLVYAFVPNQPLEDIVQQRARQVAREQLKPIEQTMRLENQALTQDDAKAALDEYIRTRLNPRLLWDKLP